MMIISTVEIIHNKTQHTQGLVGGVSKPGGFATPYSRTLNTAIFTFVVKVQERFSYTRCQLTNRPSVRAFGIVPTE